jgi:hypothetical protein
MVSLSGADSPDYSRSFVCLTGEHALFPVQEQGTSADDDSKLKPNVVCCPPGSRKGRLRVDHYPILRWIHSDALEAETIRQGKRNRYLIKKSVVEAIERREPERHRKLV